MKITMKYIVRSNVGGSIKKIEVSDITETSIAIRWLDSNEPDRICRFLKSDFMLEYEILEELPFLVY